MPDQWPCPTCHVSIPVEDVNPSTDIALCRACGRTHSFEALVDAREIAAVDLGELPKGVRIVPDPMADLRIIHRRISPIVLFFIPFTLIWGGGSIGGIYGSQIAKGQFDLGASLFGLPFLLGTIVLVSVVIMMLFGRTEIALLNGEGSVFMGVGPIGRTRRFTYSRETAVLLEDSSTRVNNRPVEQITLRTPGKRFSFGTTLGDPARKAIAAMIRSEVLHV